MSILKSVVGLGLFLFASGGAFAATHAPVIFIHGMDVKAERYETAELQKLFADAGYELRVARNLAKGSLDARAEGLALELDRLNPYGEPVHLIAHSMGGLEARLAIHRYGYGAEVLSLTTIGTPHRGTPVADYATGAPWGISGSSLKAKAIAIGTEFFGKQPEALHDLTTAFLRDRFNPIVRDDPRVRYFSMVYAIPFPYFTMTKHPGLLSAYSLIAYAGKPKNDGLVPTDSAAWGQVIDQGKCDHQQETMPGGTGKCDFRAVFRKALANLTQVFP
jgi:triacylglycerol lipase